MKRSLFISGLILTALFSAHAEAQHFAGDYERTYLLGPGESSLSFTIPDFCSVTKIDEINPESVGGELELTTVFGPDTVWGEYDVRKFSVQTNVVARPYPTNGCGSYCGDADEVTVLPRLYKVNPTQISFFDGRGLRNESVVTNVNPSYIVDKKGNTLVVTSNYLRFPPRTDDEVLVGSGVVCILTRK